MYTTLPWRRSEANQTHSEYQSTIALAASTAVFGISLLLISLRFYARMRYPSAKGHRGLWWDDWTALLALVFFAPDYVFITAVFSPVLGQPLESFSFEEKARGDAYLNSFALLFMYSMFCARLSALLFFHRVFVTSQKDGFLRFLGLMQGFNLCVMVTFMSMLPFHCRITDALSIRPELGCMQTQTMYIASAAASFTADLLVLLTPLPVLFRLNLPGMAKFFAGIPFLFGIIVVIVSGGRLIATVRLGSVLDGDVSASGMNVLWWPVAEMAAAIISISLPSIYALIRRCFETSGVSWRTATVETSTPSVRTNSIGKPVPVDPYASRTSSPRSSKDKSLPPTPPLRQVAALPWGAQDYRGYSSRV